MVYGFRTFLLASSPDPAASDGGGSGGGVLAETIEQGERAREAGISQRAVTVASCSRSQGGVGEEGGGGPGWL